MDGKVWESDDIQQSLTEKYNLAMALVAEPLVVTFAVTVTFYTER